MLLLFGLTLFLSSALLFIVEPMFAKMVLPKLGGTPAVWNVCMVFYQSLLLAGYAYAHAATTRWPARRTALLQVIVVCVALLTLPVHLPHGVDSVLAHGPTLYLLTLLALGVGVPFLVLTTYSSTLQTWYAGAAAPSAREPYVLYSAGNLGSLLGLFSYPALIERHLGLAAQSRLWLAGYVVLLVLTVCCALALWLTPAAAVGHVGSSAVRAPVTPVRAAKWLMLAFIPSSLMLGITTALTTELPPIPLIWILPLAAYLLSFVLVFASRPVAYHDGVVKRLPLLLVVAAFLIASTMVSPPIFSVPFYLAVLFLACVACHGELALSRPPPAGLTTFYLCVAIGGALGGIFNALIAPVIFNSVVELPLTLFLLALATAYMGSRTRPAPPNRWDFILPIALAVVMTLILLSLRWSPASPSRVKIFLLFIAPIFVCLSFSGRPLRFALGFAALVLPGLIYPGGMLVKRSFFGVYHVSTNGEYRLLVHGSTLHGMQSTDPRRAREPLSYYSGTGPIGQVFATSSIAAHLREVAVIGLGAGSLACYAQPGRTFTFYEIDPTVESIARNPAYFTFLRDCAPQARVVIGDARLALLDAAAHQYDLIIADAFSSDSVPVHLVTREAIELYLAKLADHGLLAFNISNRYLDLRPVLGSIAAAAGLKCLLRDDLQVDAREQTGGKTASSWIVMARTESDFAGLTAERGWRSVPAPAAYAVWTDDYSSLAGIIHWTGR